MQQIDRKQVEKFLREEWEKVVAGIAVIVFLILAAMALLGGTPYSPGGSGSPPPPRKPLLNVKSSFEFLKEVPEAGSLKGLGLTAQVGTYTPPTCVACQHTPPHLPGPCQIAGCNCGKTVVAPPPPDNTPPPPPPAKPRIAKFEAKLSALDPRMAFFSAEATVPEGGRIAQWQIDFGDDESDTSHNGWKGNEIRHSYKRDGQFNATLTCRSDRGTVAQRSILVTVGGTVNTDQAPAPGQASYKVTFMSYSNLNGYITIGTKMVNPATQQTMGKTFSLRETNFGITLETADAVQATFKGTDGKPVVIKKNQTATIPGVTE